MRYLSQTLKQFASEKFVLLSGPRQVGKTTLALSWLENKQGLFLNWDVAEERERILSRDFLNPLTQDAFVFDELHKYNRWKSWLKGLYDKEHKRIEVIVTGSARLDIFQKGGDSLLGRYENLRLHPFTLGELVHGKILSPPKLWSEFVGTTEHNQEWEQLERRSGFPEPFFRDEDLQHKRWSVQRRSLLIQQDLRELSQIREVSLVEHLALLLRSRIGSPLSINSLREELSVAHDTVNSWIEILERLYFCYRIKPYHENLERSIKKERKLYLWDWSELSDPGSRFENMVASHLLKSIHLWNDLGHGEYDLCYWRDKEKNEVDFIVCEKGKPQLLIEAKHADEAISKSLLKLLSEFPNLPAFQLVNKPGVDREKGGVRVVSASKFFAGFV